MLVTFIASLAMRQRLSRKRIQEFLNDWFQVYLGTATINQCIHEAGRAVEPVVEEEILAAVRQAELLYADETGWKERRKALWLWVFSMDFHYDIRGSRFLTHWPTESNPLHYSTRY